MGYLTKDQLSTLEMRLRILHQQASAEAKHILHNDDQPEQIALENHFAKGDEPADAEIQTDTAVSTLNHDLDFLSAIESALHKIGNGAVGVCEDCGQAIPWARLDSNPLAHTCVACQTKRENRSTHRAPVRQSDERSHRSV